MISRRFATIALGVCVCAGSAFGQSAYQGRVALSERESSGSYAADTLEMIIAHAMPSPPPPHGLMQNPQPSVAVQASDLTESLFEDAGYRIGETFDPFLGRGFEPEQTVDGDWIRVKDAEVAPYKAVCHIETTWEDGTVTSGTASFVGRRVLVTAGHCLFDGIHDGWARSVKITPARKGELGRPFGFDVCRRLAAPAEWIISDGKNLQYDIGWLILSTRKLHNRVDFHFGVRAASESRLEAFDLFSASYPEAQARGYRMYRDFETRNQIVVENYVHHYHDTLGGSSGCPLYLKAGGDYDIVAVHSHEPVDPLGITDWNTGVRMTGENIAKTRLYNQQYP